MLEVFMDRSMAVAFVNSCNKARKESDIQKRNSMMKVEAFIKQACKLKIDVGFKEYNKQLLTFFTQGVGDQAAPSYIALNEESVSANKSSVALLEKSNPLFSAISKRNYTIHKDNISKDLARLMFDAPTQTTTFQIIPHGLPQIRITDKPVKTFEGWNTLIKHPLVPLTDVVIIDPYFLKPESFKDSYDNIDVQAYVQHSLLPLMELLSRYKLGKILTLNIFCEQHPDTDDLDRELFDQLELSIRENNLDIKLIFVVSKYLNQHKRILYTNYFALKTELSFYHFQADKVTGYKKDEVSIKPFALDNPNTDPHSIMLDDLADFHKLLQKPGTKILGDKSNLSQMIIQAYNQLNPTRL